MITRTLRAITLRRADSHASPIGPVAGITRAAQRMPVAVLTTGAARPPSCARGWRLTRPDGGVYAYIAPDLRPPPLAGQRGRPRWATAP